jgi:hypothetical protein
LRTSELISEKTTMAYQQQFREIGMSLSGRLDFKEWTEVLPAAWFTGSLELEKSQDNSLKEMFKMQKVEANGEFSSLSEKNYTDWLKGQR